MLDLGAGTGVAGRAALAAGAAEVAAVDLAVGPLRQCEPPLSPLAADAAALPFRDDSFAVVLAAFSLTHAASLGAALAESRRVGRVLAASAFAPGWGHPAKTAVDAVLARFGYRPPAWYVTFKQDTEPQLGDAQLVRELALAAGYSRVKSSVLAVPTGLSAPRATSGLAARHGAHRAVRRVAGGSVGRLTFGGQPRRPSAAASR